MRIKVLQDFWSPSDKGYIAGKEYDVTEAVGQMYVERGHAEAVKEKKEEKKAEYKQEEKKVEKKK